jgi:hypothetical protein
MPAKAQFFEPMLCESAKLPPEGPEWRYEIKLDGYRAIGFKPGFPPYAVPAGNSPPVQESWARRICALGAIASALLLDTVHFRWLG